MAKKSGKLKTKAKKKLKKILKYIAFKWVFPVQYFLYSRKPINEKFVLFADYRDRDMPDNFLGLYEMCQNSGFDCIVLSGKPFANSVPKWKRRIEKVYFQFRFIKLYARCRVLFLVEDFPLVDTVKTRPETQVIQLWHGCGIMKKWGYAVTSNGWGASEKERKCYPPYLNQTLSCISSSSLKVKEGYQAAFNCNSNIIVPLGCPRTDVYFNMDFRAVSKDKVGLIFPEIKSRKIILYAPTFRGKSIPTSRTECNLDFCKMKAALGEKYVIVTKFHPQSAKGGLLESDRLKGHGFVFDATKLMSPEELLCAADILITDYSSILFEYLLFERPIISYIYDIDKYISDRGLFYPYDQLAPGPYVFNQEELLEKLLTVDQWFDVKRVREFKKEFMSACDGHSTERIFHYVFCRHQENERLICL